MAERFYGEFNKWAREHKLLSRTQAHGSPTDVLRVYGESDIPETEDLFGNGGYDFLKMAASAANIYGRRIVGSESFVWPTGAFQTTPEKMKVAADELVTAGVNAIVYHGFPYIRPEVPPPGWHPFSGIGEGNYSSQFNELNPFWPYIAQLNAYFTRLQYVSQEGTNVAAVALYRNNLMHGADELPPVPKLNQAIMDAGYNYDHINAASVLTCTIRDRMLVTAGGARYRALVLPSLDAIDAPVAEKILSFAVAGLPIVFSGQVPARAAGFLDSTSQTKRVQAVIRSLRDSQNVYICSDLKGVVLALDGAASPNIRFHSSPLSFIQKRIGRLNAFFLRNESDTIRHINAEFEAQGKPELWDPWTGQAASISNSQRNGNWVRVELDLLPLSSALIVFDPADSAPAAVATSVPLSLIRSGRDRRHRLETHSDRHGAERQNCNHCP